MKNIKCKRFFQEDLSSDLITTIAGQQFLTKLILILLLVLVCLIAGIITGLLGATTSLQVSLGHPEANLRELLVTLVLMLCINVAISRSFNNFLLTGIISLILAVITSLIGAKFISIKLSEMYFPILLITIAFNLVLGSISFFLLRFSIALSDILLVRTQWLKFILFLIVIFGAILGSMVSLVGELQDPNSQFRNILSSSIDTRIAIITSSVVISFSLALCAKLANHVRGVPWSHPSLLRSWVLAVGSWGGTSFYNLDLSNVKFRNAKLHNTDLRARKLYRTCFQGVTGLERARVDSRYLDLENPKVQKLLTEGRSEDGDFSGLNLRGAYLQNAELRRFNFTDTDLTGADMQGADLRGSLLVRAQVIGVDFTNANLTGCCIQDWSINSQTCFTDVRCEYIHRKLDEHGEPIERFPSNRSFEPREFESLYQEVENVVELIFKEGENWRAALFSLRKLQLEDEELGLELKSIEKRGDLWVLKVTHNNTFPKQEVENRLNASFDEMREKLASKEQQIDKLLDIVADQAKALKGYSKQPLGTSNNFFIVGSAITNLSGSGEIDYQEAANQVRNIVATSANSRENSSLASSLLDKFQDGAVAVNPTQQAELIEQIILAEAQKDTVFKQFLLLQGERISEAMPENAITSAIRNAIAQLNQPLP